MEYDLVFEGGGAKGLAFVGAMRALEKRGHTPRRLIGSSAGAFTAAMIAAGFSSAESLEAISEKMPDGRSRFAGFMDTPTIYKDSNVEDSLGYWLRTELDNPMVPNIIEPIVDQFVKSLISKDVIRHLVSLLLWGGWYAGDALIAWLEEKLDAGGRNLAGSTLSAFNDATGRDLSLVASDITGEEMLVLNHRTAPDCPTVWAVRMSMGCPFVWQEVFWKPEWGTYLGRDLTGHRVVDGGLLSNFPIGLFVSTDESIAEIMGKDMASNQVIGLLIDESLPVPESGDPPVQGPSAPGVLERIDLLESMIWRIRGLADTVLSAHDKFVMSSYQNMVCRLPAHGYGTLEFDMESHRMEAILNAGEAAMNGFFEQSVN